MHFSFGFRKGLGRDRLTPEQQEVVRRFERGEITAKEAERLLGEGAYAFEFSVGNGSDSEGDSVPGPPEKPAFESPEDVRARELVERIAREVDEETRG